MSNADFAQVTYPYDGLQRGIATVARDLRFQEDKAPCCVVFKRSFQSAFVLKESSVRIT